MNLSLSSVQPQRTELEAGRPVSPRPVKTAFADVLRATAAETEAVRFSAHALQRARQRHIDFSPEQQARLCDAMTRLEAKGCKQAVVLLDTTALVVSVPNRTVITLMDAQEMADTVFTNIDSAVLAPDAGATDRPSAAPLSLM